ncbi:MAG TPA: beta-propeller fold lactonase family protein, partial [Chloroflexia bacterium]|nr:beta-propeller fold lactonase family protein [Chloroflexia bacterium]
MPPPSDASLPAAIAAGASRRARDPLLYVGSYAPADHPGIHAFHFDPSTGTLTARGAVAGVPNPSYLAAHPNGRWLYAVSETAVADDGVAGAVTAWRMTVGPAPLQGLNMQPSG